MTHSFAVPYEGIGDLAIEVLRRWGLVIETPDMSPGGFCIGWQAEPVARLDRGPVPPHEGRPIGDDDALDLDGFQQSTHMSDAFHERWGLPPDEDVFCTGRPSLGWFPRNDGNR